MARQIEVEIEVEKPCRIQVVRHSIMHEYVALTIRSTFSCVIAHLVHFYRDIPMPLELGEKGIGFRICENS